jgi:hypothetical protein
MVSIGAKEGMSKLCTHMPPLSVVRYNLLEGFLKSHCSSAHCSLGVGLFEFAIGFSPGRMLGQLVMCKYISMRLALSCCTCKG